MKILITILFLCIFLFGRQLNERYSTLYLKSSYLLIIIALIAFIFIPLFTISEYSETNMPFKIYNLIADLGLLLLTLLPLTLFQSIKLFSKGNTLLAIILPFVIFFTGLIFLLFTATKAWDFVSKYIYILILSSFLIIDFIVLHNKRYSRK